ncbi:MAG: exonuclease SbcCD subunit D [Acidobacteriota bacterium]|nr:exonuclease SbcCD subunit D [Blastocatellia bacterium]MDW8413573.1 exonuclease SbcCD subunit D [Acidobacteriota bacterium]
MTKFLHISDIHLGIRRYNCEERTRDFFYAWFDCLQKYAIAEKVDFVLIGGDLFDRRQIDPQAANHAVSGLSLLKNSGIPVFAIEGNHDQRETYSQFSWLRSLSQWGFLKLLEPVHEGSTIKYLPWNEKRCEGGYIDYKDVRIFGSRWYGTTTSEVLPRLCDAIRPQIRENGYNIMLLHTEVEGYCPAERSILSVPQGKLLQLRDCGINYLALGHIHKNFDIAQWAFNPGSLEATTADEYKQTRGAYLVELHNQKIHAKLVSDYKKRSFLFKEFDLSKYPDPESASKTLTEFLTRECQQTISEPIVDVRLYGRVHFRSSLLKLEQIKQQVCSTTPVMNIIFHNEAVPAEYPVATELGPSAARQDRERRVLEDLVAQDSRLRANAEEIAALILEIKRLVLADEPSDKLIKLLEKQLNKLGNRA